jgi:hypothetical protein
LRSSGRAAEGAICVERRFRQAVCVHQIQMSPSLPFTNVTGVGLARSLWCSRHSPGPNCPGRGPRRGLSRQRRPPGCAQDGPSPSSRGEPHRRARQPGRFAQQRGTRPRREPEAAARHRNNPRRPAAGLPLSMRLSSPRRIQRTKDRIFLRSGVSGLTPSRHSPP